MMASNGDNGNENDSCNCDKNKKSSKAQHGQILRNLKEGKLKNQFLIN